MYTLEGNELKLEGPIRITEIRKRARLRFVRVDFFEWQSNARGQTIPQKFMSSYAWQGENALHLLEQPLVMAVDPFGEDEGEGGEMTPMGMDAQHSKLMTISGERHIHLDVL